MHTYNATRTSNCTPNYLRLHTLSILCGIRKARGLAGQRRRALIGAWPVFQTFIQGSSILQEESTYYSTTFEAFCAFEWRWQRCACLHKPTFLLSIKRALVRPFPNSPDRFKEPMAVQT